MLYDFQQEYYISIKTKRQTFDQFKFIELTDTHYH